MALILHFPSYLDNNNSTHNPFHLSKVGLVTFHKYFSADEE
jgi:hypothetical protein